MHILDAIDSFVWGPFTIILLVGTGIFLTIRMKFVQLLRFSCAWKLISGKHDDPKDEGDITHFQALATALSATVGTGNIAGVATAIAAGGPGAVFWMWMTAFFGMATKFTCCTLAMKYRRINPDGSASGGPMYYLEKGLGQKWLGVLFAFFAMTASFGIGNMVQANSVAEPLAEFGIPKIATGLIIGVLVGMVILGGIRRIAGFASKIVPFMCIVYVLGALFILLTNYELVPGAFALIFKHAFQPTAASGGFLGATVAQTMRMGVARGLFSNEAGLGSSPIAHAAARTQYPVREGMVAMLEPFIDTICICSMTAAVILISGLWTSIDPITGKQLTGTVLSASAFENALPGLGKYIVSFGIIFFAFSTIISWSYYGDRSTEYLFGPKSVFVYRVIYTLTVPIGASLALPVVWTVSDIMNGLMAFPNLIGLILLSGVVVKESKEYFNSDSHACVQNYSKESR